MKLLIIAGAGASYDSYPAEHGGISDNLRLPLANNLFGESSVHNQKKLAYPVAGVESRVRRAIRSNPEEFDIEELMYQIFRESENASRGNLREQLFIARFYLRSVIEEIATYVLAKTRNLTTYVELLQMLDDWQSISGNEVKIVTFNYDNLIEEALRQQYSWRYPTQGTSDFRAYYEYSPISLYKVHGSVNWWREGISNNDEHQSFVYDACFGAYNYIIPESFDKYIFASASYTGKPNHIYMPAVSLPLKQKDAFDDCPLEIVENMRKELPDTDAILVLGWKGADNHFVEELRKAKHIKKIYIVNKTPESGNLALKRLAGLTTQYQRIDEGFTDFIKGKTFDGVLKELEGL